jgi:hypothetical protein
MVIGSVVVALGIVCLLLIAGSSGAIAHCVSKHHHIFEALEVI